MNQMTRHLQLVFACVLGLVPRVVVAGDESLPIGFRFVGNYQLEKRVKIRDAKPFVVRSKPFVCRVYTDGIKCARGLVTTSHHDFRPLRYRQNTPYQHPHKDWTRAH